MSAMFSFFKRRIRWTFILLLILSILTEVSGSCPRHQKAYGGSCFEVVALRHTFPAAQAWCEQRGGHLACTPNGETQLFFQTHLDPDEDFWLGAASWTTKAAQDSPSEGERFEKFIKIKSQCSKRGWRARGELA